VTATLEMARGPLSGVVHSNRLLGACGANLLRGESERPGGKGDDGDNAFAGESGGLRAAGILGDDLEETGAGGVRGGSEDAGLRVREEGTAI